MDTIGSNIIFTMGMSGAGKFKAQALMAVGAIAAIGAAILKVQGQAEEFRMAFERLTDEQIHGVMAMDKATAGFMDTMGLLQVQATATEMGLAQNNEAMEAMAKVSLDISRKLGEGPDAMIARLKELVEGVGKGTTRSLKKFGIDLSTALRDAGKSTEDMAAAQDMALKMVIERASELSDTVGSENMREGFNRMNNDIETTLGLMWGSVSNSGGGLASAFDVVHAKMGSINDLMMSPDTKDSMQSYIWSLDGIRDASFSLHGSLTGILTGFLDVGNAADTFAKKVAWIKAQAGLKEQARARGRKIGGSLGAIDAAEQAQFDDMLADEYGLGSTSQMAPEKSVLGSKAKKKGRGGGGGGGGKYTPNISETMSPEEWILAGGAVSAEADANEAIEMLLADRSVTYEEAFAGYDELMMSEQEIKEAFWDRELEMEQETRALEEERHAYRMMVLGEEESRRVSASERAFGIEQAHLDASLDHWESGVQGKAEMMSGFFGSMAKGMEVFGKRGWKAAKAMMIAETIASTIAASVSAYKSLVGIPYVGVGLAIAAATSTMAWGMSQVAKIAKLKYEGGASAGVAGGGPAMGGGGVGSGSFGGGYGGEGGGVTNIEVVLGEEPILKASLNANDGASMNGQRHFKVSA